MVDVAKMTPQAKEASFKLRLMVVTEVGKEAFEHLALFVVEIRNVVELVYILEVAEYAVGIGHILVNIVEVGQQ